MDPAQALDALPPDVPLCELVEFLEMALMRSRAAVHVSQVRAPRTRVQAPALPPLLLAAVRPMLPALSMAPPWQVQSSLANLQALDMGEKLQLARKPCLTVNALTVCRACGLALGPFPSAVSLEALCPRRTLTVRAAQATARSHGIPTTLWCISGAVPTTRSAQ